MSKSMISSDLMGDACQTFLDSMPNKTHHQD